MGWAVGFDQNWKRDIGYGVPAICDQPGCGHEIDRGLAYVCGGEPFGGEEGCGLFFCPDHLDFGHESQLCDRCVRQQMAYIPTPDTAEWVTHKLTDPSWQRWRDENPDEVSFLKTATPAQPPVSHGENDVE